MKVRYPLSVVVAFGLLFPLAPFVRAQESDADPTLIARRCVIHARELAQRCVEHNTELCHECLRRIHLLLEAGNEARARAVASRCIYQINETTRQCVETIREDCRRCIAAIEAAGGSADLIEAVKRACERAVDYVLANRERCVNAIHAAFEADDGA
jgi:hypothetical protein